MGAALKAQTILIAKTVNANMKNGPQQLKIERVEGHPQQNIFFFDNPFMTISSNFDSGNLFSAVQESYDKNHVRIIILLMYSSL